MKTRSGYFQWILVACGVIVVAALVVNAVTTDRLVRALVLDMARLTDASRGQQGTPAANAPTANANVNAPVATAPQNVDIPGTRMTLTLPGGPWTKDPTNHASPFAMTDGSARISAETAQIATEDFQAWFKANHDVYDQQGGKAIVGPNQVLVGGKLAIDETVTTVSEVNGSVFTARYVFVRDGGMVIVLEMSNPPGQPSAMWDDILKTVTFQQ